MKYTAFLTLLLLLTGCAADRIYEKGVMNTGNIAVQIFQISADGDTVLKTHHGSRFIIRRGTYPSGQSISIKIREVLTNAEILLSGIPTISNGRPLKSAGMIFFEASVNGNSIEPAQPVEANISADVVDLDMQIFKGEMGEDSLLNWVEPVSLDTVPQLAAKQRGRSLFTTKCASCHNIYSDATGPAMFNFHNRKPWTDRLQLLAFIRDPAKYMAVSRYMHDQKERYGSVMIPFPELTTADIEDIIAYVASRPMDAVRAGINRTDTSTTGLAIPASDASAMDCGVDTLYFPSFDTTQQFVSSPAAADAADDTSYFAADIDMMDTLYSGDDTNTIQYGAYSFDISANGWYNIDQYIPENNSVPASDLAVTVTNPAAMALNVVLFIPSSRIHQYLVRTANGVYKIPYENARLNRNERAIVMAFGSLKDQTYYGIGEFMTGKSSNLTISLKETTPEKLKNVLTTYRIDGVDIRSTRNEMVISSKDCNGNPRPRNIGDTISRPSSF